MRLSEVNCPLKQSIETSGWEIGNSYDTLAKYGKMAGCLKISSWKIMELYIAGEFSSKPCLIAGDYPRVPQLGSYDPKVKI